jgi:small GTP-binding protein
MFTRPSKEISVMIVGSSGSGKSALTARLLGNQFPAVQRPTNGINFTATLHLDPQNATRKLKLHIADTSGDRSYSDLVASYLVDVTAVVFVIDPTIFTGKQFQNIINCIIDTCPQARLAIVISKADRLETEDDRSAIQIVVSQFIKRMAETMDVDFSLYMVSAKNNDDLGVKKLLEHILALPGVTPQAMPMLIPPAYNFQKAQLPNFAPSLFARPMKLPPLQQNLTAEKKPKLG